MDEIYFSGDESPVLSPHSIHIEEKPPTVENDDFLEPFEITAPKIKRAKTKIDEILNKVSNHIDIIDDKYDIMGKNIANKLRELPNETVVVAEKVINDVLYEAFLGNIHRGTKFSILQESRTYELNDPVIPSTKTEFLEDE